MKIGVYISELLYEHDSVVLPGFGEFYTKYTPAKFIPEAGKVESPSKTIAFNPDKREGDTHLINHLSEQQHMEPGQVSEYLLNFASEIEQLLDSGKKVELERIGMFSKDASGSILFEPDTSINYLNIPIGEVPEPPKKVSVSKPVVAPAPDSGYVEGRAPETTSQTIPPLQNEQKEREDYHMEKEKKTELPRALKWVAFTVIPLLIIIIILAINYDFFFGKTGTNRDKEMGSETEQVPSDELTGSAYTGSEGDAAGSQASPATAESTQGVSASSSPGTAAPAVSSQPAASGTPVAAQEPPQRTRGQTIYYIVVGSFPDEEKAEKLAQTLRNEGAPMASVFMETGFNYHRVCYGYYYDLAEAERLLPSVRENVNPEAYILHR
jgi:nucleoid DNA-binding protein